MNDKPREGIRFLFRFCAIVVIVFCFIRKYLSCSKGYRPSLQRFHHYAYTYCEVIIILMRVARIFQWCWGKKKKKNETAKRDNSEKSKKAKKKKQQTDRFGKIILT